MKKNYLEPEIEIVKITSEEIASGTGQGGGESGMGDDGWS